MGFEFGAGLEKAVACSELNGDRNMREMCPGIHRLFAAAGLGAGPELSVYSHYRPRNRALMENSVC